MVADDFDCPVCGGSGRIAPSGEGLYDFLAASKARIEGLERAVARALELRERYVSENATPETPKEDYRIILCDEEIAAYRRSANFHRAAAQSLRDGDTAAICTQCCGEGVVGVDTSFAPRTSDEMISALQRAVA